MSTNKRDAFLKLNKQRAEETNSKKAAGYTIVEEEKTEQKIAEKHETSANQITQDDNSSTEKVKPGSEKINNMAKTHVISDEQSSSAENNTLTTVQKPVISEEKKNNVITRTFSIDRGTNALLAAYVSVLHDSGTIIDKRPITESSFVRLALLHEFERISNLNGSAFKEAVDEEMKKTPKGKTKFRC